MSDNTVLSDMPNKAALRNVQRPGYDEPAGAAFTGGRAYKIGRAVLAGGGACHAFWQAETREDRPYIASI